MDYQVLFNIAIGVAGIFGGWVLNRIYNAIDKLDADVRSMPHTYVTKEDLKITKEDFKTATAELKTDIRMGFQQIDRTLASIFDRLNEKADKP